MSRAKSPTKKPDQAALAARAELREHDPPAAAWLDYIDRSDPDFPATEDQESCFHAGWFAARGDAAEGTKDLVRMMKRLYNAEREWVNSMAAFKDLFPEEPV